MLVQVTKEERGNKGAALTTYLSLAGRYCVLMPNSLRAGGISRKISDGKDRKRIKEILEDLEIPQGISIIVRTAGSERNKTEIKRDYEYLSRLWDQIRQDTLEANAPALIYEEGNLIKRALRDMYQSETGDIWVEGETGYKTAKNFMKMLMPTHVKRVQQYKDPIVPLFQRHHVEEQIDSILKPVAILPSGGYLVINQTEALVSIDVNSGRAIRERNIEETALRTNLEAADELARQLRLRDLAGLVVVDFIDMEDRRNNHVVEKALRDALRHDRARLQVGRISNFGLLEMSRQRLRPSVTELNSETCSHCAGAGRVRSSAGQALQIIRAIEVEGMQNRTAVLKVHTHTGIAFYMLNTMREALQDIEQRYHFHVVFAEDHSLGAQEYRLETVETLTEEQRAEYNTPSHEAYWAERAKILAEKEEQAKRQNKAGGRNERRRGRDRFNRDRDRTQPQADTEQGENREHLDIAADGSGENVRERSERGGRGRRGRRGGRRREGEYGENRFTDNTTTEEFSTEDAGAYPLTVEQPHLDLPITVESNVPVAEVEAEKPRRGRGRAKAKSVTQPEATSEIAAVSSVRQEKPVVSPPIEIIAAPKQRSAEEKSDKKPENVALITDSPEKPKKGWWSKFVI
jgi:ribonuclease E